MYKNNMLIVDNYELDTYRGCPRKYYYSIFLGRSPIGQTRVPLEFGIAVHLALELYSKGKSVEECMIAAREAFEPHEEMSDDKRTTGKLVELLAYYFDYYTISNMHPLKEMSEIGFAVDLTPTITYTGRIDDFWSIDEYPGEVFPVDTKTASSVSSYIVQPNAQFTGYIFGASEHYENVGGLVCNLIGVYKNKPKPLKNGEGWYANSAPSDVFFRVVTKRNTYELKEWKEDTLFWCDQIKRSIDGSVWPKRTLNCSAYFSQCEYIGVCNMPSCEMQEELIRSEMFVDNPWEPYPTEKTPSTPSDKKDEKDEKDVEEVKK